MVKHQFVNDESNALWSICMYTYLRIIGPSFLHRVFLFSQVGVLVVNFDGFFTLAYSSHILWSWPLGKTWYHHFFFLQHLSQRSPTLPYIFFFRKGIMEPTLLYIFRLPPSLIMPLSVQFGFSLVMRLHERRFGLFTRNCFHVEFLEFQSYSGHRNHFDISLKQTHSEEIQMIPMDRFSEVMKTFFVLLLVKVWSDILLVKEVQTFNLRVTKNWSSKHSFWLYE